MTARIATVAFQGIDTLPIDVQVQVGNGLPAFTMVRPSAPAKRLGGGLSAALMMLWLTSCATHELAASCVPPKPPEERVEVAQGAATRQNGALTLATERDPVVLTDGRCEADSVADDCTTYKLVDHFADLRLSLVHVRYYEGEGYLLIDHKFGHMMDIPGPPLFSPDRGRFVSTLVGGSEANYDPNRLAIWTRAGGFWDREIEVGLPGSVELCAREWQGSREIVFNGDHMQWSTEEKAMRHAYFAATARWNGWYWTLSGTPEGKPSP